MSDDKPAPIHCGVLVTTCGLNADYERFTGTWTLAEVTCEVCIEREERRRAARRAPRQEPDESTIAAINHSLKVMAEHGGGTPDHVEERAMDSVKPAPHPTPWRIIDDGIGTDLWDASDNRIMKFYVVMDGARAGQSVVRIPSAEARAVIEAAPEMADLLRRAAELVNWLTPFAFAYAAEHPESNMPTKLDVDDVCRGAVELLARIDAAKT